MPKNDYRTKPDTQWTFYVVDNLVTMANIYYFDTVEEAIEKYKTLPENLRSAIGSSIHSKPGGNIMDRHEIDHIHKIDGKSVLIRDMERMTSPIWRESQEIADAVTQMRLQLRVEYERSGLFGSPYGGVAIPVTDKAHALHENKMLSPRIPDKPLSGINEVFVSGRGWVDILTFLDDLNKRAWSPATGYPVPFIDTMNVRYLDNKGHTGQVDVSPADFLRMRDKFIHNRDKKPSLDARISDADAKVTKHAEPEKGRTPAIHNIEEVL